VVRGVGAPRGLSTHASSMTLAPIFALIFQLRFKMRSEWFLSVLVVLVGCGTPDRSATPTAKAVPAVTSAPIAAAGSVASASAPESLVTEFVKRDAAGERLRESPWFDSVVTEADQEGGYDSFTAIKRFQVGAGTSPRTKPPACSRGRTRAFTCTRRCGPPMTIGRLRHGSRATARGIPSRWSG